MSHRDLPAEHTAKFKYRPDIDGLRAVAVLLVLFFHAFPESMPGGFIGVDVFFVISGFLISSLIFNDLAEGKFSILDFYSRRIRRIFPSLLLVLAATIGFGAVALFTDELRNLTKHGIAGALFVSNLALWREAGYFNEAAAVKPLLHLWSLAIEEQFYIVWPLLMAFCYQRRWIVPLLTLTAAGSFAMGILQMNVDPVGAFFLPLSRFWELIIGAMLAYLVTVRNIVGKKWVHDLSGWLGLGLLGTGVLLCREHGFPGAWAALPVFGAAGIIFAGREFVVSRLVLSHPLMVGIGLISYPLYLWHWPLLSFAHIVNSGLPAVEVRAALLVASFALAYGTYLLVERPIRFRLPASQAIFGLSSCMLCFTVLSAALFYVQESSLRNDRAPASVTRSDCPTELHSAELDFCALSGPRPEAAVWGDSHADHLFHGLALNDRRAWLLAANGRCPPLSGITVNEASGRCRERNDAIVTYLGRQPGIRLVVLSFFSGSILETNFAAEHMFNGLGPSTMRLNGEATMQAKAKYFEQGLLASIAQLKALGKQVVLLFDVPELPFAPKDCLTRPLTSGPRRPECSVPLGIIAQRQVEMRKVVQEVMLKHPDVAMYDPQSVFCRDSECRAKDRDALLYRDSHHLSAQGSARVAQAFLDWSKSTQATK